MLEIPIAIQFAANFAVIYLLVFEINKLDLRDREQRSRETGKKLKAEIWREFRRKGKPFSRK